MTAIARRALGGLAGLTLALSAAGLLLPGGLELRVTPVEGGEPLLSLPIEAGEPFTIRDFHSVENAPVWEVHSADAAGTLHIEEERYLRFGAGMGTTPGVGRMARRGPLEVIEDMHRPVGDFILRIGSPGVDHTLLWRGLEADLTRMAPHRAVRFTAEPVSRMYRTFRTLLPHPATRRLQPEKGSP